MNVLVLGGLSHLATNFILTYGRYLDNIIVVDKVSYCSQSKEIIKRYVYKAIWLNALDVDLESIIVFHKIRCIINTAASTHVDKSYEDISIFSNDNINLVAKLMNTIRDLKKLNYTVKLIHLSTDEVYGDNYEDNDSSNCLETYTLSPTNPYSATKASGDMIINSYCYSYNLWNDIIVLRPNNLAGFFQYPDKIIPLFYHKIKENKDIVIHGDGLQKRCFVSTLLVCDIIYSLILNISQWYSKSTEEVACKNVFYNIGYNSQAGIKVIDIFNIIKHTVNTEYIGECIFSVDRPYNDKMYRVCNKKIINLLTSFQNKTNLERILTSINETSEDALKNAIDQFEQFQT